MLAEHDEKQLHEAKADAVKAFVRDNNRDLLVILHKVFIGVVTLTCILGAVHYWALLMGITQSGALRFDVAPTHWRIMGTALCLVLPLTALGVWFRNGFGVWGWSLITIVQIVMHGVLPHMFGDNLSFLAISSLIMFLFIVFDLMFYRRNHSQE